ncbi:glucose-methanol-choline oxidoreductase [Xylariomycetidae sp. FL0641]|nr:glucose-methanol-choline oxidoreductase [Xylariomycetidae sp. FL0641]
MPADEQPEMVVGGGEAARATGADKPTTNGVHKRGRSHAASLGAEPQSNRSCSSSSVDSFERSPGLPQGELPTNGQTNDHLKPGGSHPSAPKPPSYGYHEEDPRGPQSRAYARIRSYVDGPEKMFPRIGKPVELMRHSYDCVVIGSGYGGGVAASRMARAGQSVCLLERGKERWPGEYPSSTSDSFEQVHYSGEFAPSWLPRKIVDGGDPTGMYHVVFGNGQNAVVCNGLGGTSLMNANVYLEADEDALKQEQWPSEIRDNPGCLNKYYQKAKEVLEPEEYPAEWPPLPKLELLKKQAEHLNMDEKFRRVKQTTRFHNGPNSCGVEMTASASTGQDGTGLNDGSKTTTLVTYLADAWNWGADMFCEVEVRYVTKAPDRAGYIIYFAWHGRNRGHFKANLHGDLMWVHAREAVFLGAGAIGTTEILLRSRAMGLDMSPKVGQNMSGNGDILAFGYNTDYEVNAIGKDFPSPYHPIGPCITGIIDNRKGHDNPLDGYVIEEGTIPGALAPFMQALLELLPGSIGPQGESLYERIKGNLARAGTFFLGPYFRQGAMERTQVYLIMSHDSNQAYLSLKEDKPVLEFIGVGRSDHVKHLNHILEKATKAVGGTFVQNPWYALMGQQQVTVHPVGGACMGDSGASAVTNHRGEVYTGVGKETHKGLIVTDAALIPAALGANPFATITALAERCLDLYAEEQNLHISQEKNGLLDLFDHPQHPHQRRKHMQHHEHVQEKEEDKKISSARDSMAIARSQDDGGFGFTEVMSGWIHRDRGFSRDDPDTYELAARTAQSRCESARFFLSVQSFNTRNIVHDPNHKALLTGTFVCPTLEGSPLMVQRGDFNLFLVDHKAPGTRNLTYDFGMRGVNGKRYHFHGYKVVDSSVALSPVHFWKSTSTLYVTITEEPHHGKNHHKNHYKADNQDGDVTNPRWPIIAKGIMKIQPQDFASELMTLTPTGSNIFKKALSAANFLTFFTRKSLSLLLAPLYPLQYPSQTYAGFVNNCRASDSAKITARDGVVTVLHIWEPTNTSIPARNLMMIPGASVDHQIFALPTIKFHAVDYFRRAGYRVFVPVLRIGALMVAQHNYTTFDARLDIKASLEYIREHYPQYPLEKHHVKQKGKKPMEVRVNGINGVNGVNGTNGANGLFGGEHTEQHDYVNVNGHDGHDGQNGHAADDEPREQEPIYCIAHCMGSVAFSTGLLDGTIPASWIKGITCSQVFMNPIWNAMNMIKIMASPVPADRVYRLLAGEWFSCSTAKTDSTLQKALNELLRLLPDERRELCNNASCHRISLVFARCWNHRNLNEATHRQIDRFFGGVNMTLLHLLMKQGFDGGVMSNAPLFERLDAPRNVRRLKGIPFLLFVGRDNAVLSPESTEKTYEVLTDTFGTTHAHAQSSGDVGIMYRRRVVPDYGHLDCWMGRNAWRDVYPFVREEVDRVTRGPEYRFEPPNDRFKQMIVSGELLDR